MSEDIQLVLTLCALFADNFHLILIAMAVALVVIAASGFINGRKAHAIERREREAEKEKEETRRLQRQERETQRAPHQPVDPERPQREHAARVRREMREDSTHQQEQHLQLQRQVEAEASRTLEDEQQQHCDPRLQELWSV